MAAVDVRPVVRRSVLNTIVRRIGLPMLQNGMFCGRLLCVDLLVPASAQIIASCRLCLCILVRNNCTFAGVMAFCSNRFFGLYLFVTNKQVEEGREAEATIQSPSINTRSRTPHLRPQRGPAGITPRGRGTTTGERPTPIVWDGKSINYVMLKQYLIFSYIYRFQFAGSRTKCCKRASSAWPWQEHTLISA